MAGRCLFCDVPVPRSRHSHCGPTPLDRPRCVCSRKLIDDRCLCSRQERGDEWSMANAGVDAALARTAGRMAWRLDLSTALPAQDKEGLLHSGVHIKRAAQPSGPYLVGSGATGTARAAGLED